MSKKRKTNDSKITIDGKEYLVDNLLDEQKLLVNHVSDLDNKMRTMEFNLQQLRVGREAFFTKLKNSLESVEE